MDKIQEKILENQIVIMESLIQIMLNRGSFSKGELEENLRIRINGTYKILKEENK